MEIVCEQVEGLLRDEPWGLMAIGLLDLVGVSVSCVASFGMRRGERRCFFI